MVNIAQFKEKLKSKLYGDSVTNAKGLKSLREERLRLEGRAKLINLENKERARIAKANKTLKENSSIYKFGQGLKKVIKDNKKRIKVNDDNPWRR